MTQASNSTPVIIKPEVGYREFLQQAIEGQVRGSKGLVVALRETINNSLDAQAKNVRIQCGTHQKVSALIIMDDGVGVSSKGLVSIMSYFISSRLRKDNKTIGANGTGRTALLGLGDIYKTRVTILTISEEYPNGIEASFDFEYLVQLLEQKIDSISLESFKNKSDFQQNWPRKSGTTVILTGFDEQTVKDEVHILGTLSTVEEITTRTSERISVFVKHSWKKLVKTPIVGTPLTRQGEMPLLGKVDLELYHGGPNDGPTICGPINSIMSFTDIYKTFSIDQKNRISKHWLSIGGYIYIENANQFRGDDNEFKSEFYKGRACEQLVMILAQNNQSIEELSEDTTQEKKAIESLRVVMKRISEISKSLFGAHKVPDPVLQTKDIVSTEIPKLKEIDLIPLTVRLRSGEETNVRIENRGARNIDFSDAVWKSASEDITSIEGKGEIVKFRPGKLLGKCEATVRGSFGSHVIKVIRDDTEPKPRIKGPKFVNPGDRVSYLLCEHDSDKVLWVFDGNAKGFEFDNDTGNPKSMIVIIPKDTNQLSVNLMCTTLKNKPIAQKNIVVIKSKEDKPLTVTIGKQEYYMQFGSYHKCMVQIERPSDDELPSLILNPLHEGFGKLNLQMRISEILSALATAGIADQVEQGILTASESMHVNSEFIPTFKKRMKGMQ